MRKVTEVHMDLRTSTKNRTLPRVGRGWYSCPVEQGDAPRTDTQAIPFLQVCHAAWGGWQPVLVSLEHLPEIQPSAVRKDPSLQLWSLVGALTCLVFVATSHSAASHCLQNARLPAAQPGSNSWELAMVEYCFEVWSITRGKKKQKTHIKPFQAPSEEGRTSHLIHVSE